MPKMFRFTMDQHILVWLVLGTALLSASDWPQFQADPSRTGRTADSVAPPYRARWVWCGPTLTLRNRESESGWPDDLRTRDGYSYPLPKVVDFTLANSVQPVIADDRVFVGTMEGIAYAINATNGATLWSNSIPGGTTVSAAAIGDIVVFVTLQGAALGFDTASGRQRWMLQTHKVITSAPCAVGDRVFFASQDRHVYAVNARSGTQLWRSPRLNAPIQGGLCADTDTIYVGAEDMTAYALRQNDGGIRASHRLRGQSFRLTHPVVYGGFVIFTTGMTPMMGSEYINTPMLDAAKDIAEEEAIYARWLAGDTNG